MSIGSIFSSMVGVVRRAGGDLATGNKAFFQYVEAIVPQPSVGKALHPQLTDGAPLVNPFAEGGSTLLVKVASGDSWISANDVKGKGIALSRGSSNRREVGYGSEKKWETQQIIDQHVVFGAKADGNAIRGKSMKPFYDFAPEPKLLTSPTQAEAVRGASRRFVELTVETLPEKDRAAFLEGARQLYFKQFPGHEAEWPAAAARPAAAAADAKVGWSP